MRTRRGLFLLATLASGVVGLVVLAGFVWPKASPPDFVDLGPAERYAPGTGHVFTDLVDFTDARWGVPTLMSQHNSPVAAHHPVSIALVRHEDGAFSAFLARDPKNGCRLHWREDLPAFEGGHWRDPCHSATYNEYGERVFGPSPKDMDAFDVTVDSAGHVIVDLRTLHEGETMPPAPWGTPPPTATPTVVPR